MKQHQLFRSGWGKLKSTYLVGINANLKKIDDILHGIHLVGKRSELKVKAEELAQLVEMVRREAYLMSIAKENEKYTISPANHSHRMPR